jgi:hypothetical protein
LLLCEVALGAQQKMFGADSTLPVGLPKTAHSVMGCGKRRPDPKNGQSWNTRLFLNHTIGQAALNLALCSGLQM